MDLRKPALDSSFGKLRILLLGNSFTFFNEMPTALLEPILKAAGLDAQVTAVTCGGYYLHQFLDPSDPYGAKALGLLESQPFDAVILQEQSNNPIADPALFYDAVRGLAQKVRANGARLWLYETWGYEARNPDLCRFAPDTFAMEMKLRAAYTAIARETGASVAFAGAAMSRALKTIGPDIYSMKDFYHPSLLGSRLAAWTLAGTLLGKDPRSLPLPPNEAGPRLDAVRGAAAFAVLEDISVQAGFAVSSEGVTHR